MKKHHLYLIYLLIAWLIAASCANIVTPTGGAKDLTAPSVIVSEPVNGTKQFEGNTIKISFSEFVKLSDVSKQVIISPFTLEPPEIKTRGKSVIIEFGDSLRSNTTYSIAFGNAISDITEGNVIRDYRFVFSTGSVIDTCRISGIIKNALTQKAEADVFVMLYTQYEDSVPLQKMPYYLARTGDDGIFTFSSIPGNSYKIFALKDVNSDYLFDQPNEKIAFLDTLIKSEAVDTTNDSVFNKTTYISLNLFEEEAAIQKLLKTYPAMYGKINLAFRKPLENASLREVIIKGSGYKKELNKTKDTLTLWMNNPEDDSLIVEVTDNGQVLDTAEVALLKKSSKTGQRSGGVMLALRAKTNIISKTSCDYYKPITLEFSNPIVDYNFSKVILTENKDTVTFPVNLTYSLPVSGDSVFRKFIIDYKWKEGTSYSLLLLPEAFHDVFGLPNDTIKVNFKTSESKDYGNIKFKITTKEKYNNLIVQLVNNEDVLITENSLQNDSIVNFNFVRPGTYKVKLIVDSNSNGKWDTGNYLKHIQPEKVYYNPTPIEIKANWDAELEWPVED